MPHWPTVRLHDASRFQVGRTLLITYGKHRQEIGEATILCLCTVAYNRLSPLHASLLSGKDNPNYVRAILRKIYPGIQENDLLDYMVLVWAQRYLQQQQDMVKQWWQTQVETTPNYEQFKNQLIC